MTQKQFIDLGQLYYSKGEYDRAITAYTDGISHFPESDGLYTFRAIVRTLKGDWDEAIADYSEALSLGKNISPDLLARRYAGRGMAYQNKGDWDKALADFDEAIRLNPNEAGVYNYRGQVRSQKGDAGGAIADYSEAIRLGKDTPPEDLWRLYFGRAELYKNTGAFDEALADYDAVIRLNPGLAASALVQRAWVHDMKGYRSRRVEDYKNAIADCNEAIGKLDPQEAVFDLALAYCIRGEAYSNLGDLNQGLADAEKAVELYPDEPLFQNSLQQLRALKAQRR